jgi:hypothetical protein
MNPLGIQLQINIGANVPLPVPDFITHALQSVEVTHNDTGRSGFQLSLKAGRSAENFLDYQVVESPLLRPFNRVLMTVAFKGLMSVLMDGVITNIQFQPGSGPGEAVITITGEDVSFMMDREEKQTEHPAQDETIIANAIILGYSQYQLVPMVIPPPSIDVPIPTDRTPTQQGTDLAYLQQMASRHGYVFYVLPGPLPGMNLAYWGPPVRAGLPQPGLKVNQGHSTNVTSVNFQFNPTEPTIVQGRVQDRQSGQSVPVVTAASTRVPLAREPALNTYMPQARKVFLDASSGGGEGGGAGGLMIAQAFARAQGITDRSVDNVLAATGEIDTLKYNSLLAPRGLVGLAGVGLGYDGDYYVKSVSHSIRVGEYKQRFTLTRDGAFALTQFVRP